MQALPVAYSIALPSLLVLPAHIHMNSTTISDICTLTFTPSNLQLCKCCWRSSCVPWKVQLQINSSNNVTLEKLLSYARTCIFDVDIEYIYTFSDDPIIPES